MSINYDENTIKEFVAENRDHLEEIEPDLLAMERATGEIEPEIINRVFRAIHSIKGSSGFFRFSAIKEVSHVMENLLMLIRDGKLDPGPQGIDALLGGVDKLRIMFADVENSDRLSYQEEIERLNSVLEKAASSSREEVLPSNTLEKIKEDKAGWRITRQGKALIIHPPVESGLTHSVIDADSEQAVRDALAHGNYVYAVRHPDGNDRRSLENLEALMEEYGRCLYRGQRQPESSGVLFIFATVMETDLLCETMGLEERHAFLIESGILPHLEHGTESPRLTSGSSQEPEPEPAGGTPAASADLHQNEEKGPSYETIRVPVDVIDSLMNLAGELVLGRNQLRQALEETVVKSPNVGPILQGVDVVTSDVQEKIMQMRMQPVANLFNRFSRLVRDVSRQLNKEVELVLLGREVELDKSILEGLSDPVIHLLRNALDHGIEGTEERQTAGKPSKGTIKFRAFHEGGQVIISVRDDGRGIDPDKVAQKAVSLGIVSQDAADRMTGKEKNGLIFVPGVSTSEIISEISGRGVGMDVVKTNIEKLGGYIDIDSEKGKWTLVQIRLPLTLAIIPSLIVGAEGHRFAVPQANVKELVCVRAGEVAFRIEEVAGSEVLRLRDTLLPLIRLTDVLELQRSFIHPVTGEKIEDRRNRLLDRRNRSSPTDDLDLDDVLDNERDRRAEKDRRQSWHSDLYVVVLKLGENRFGLCVDKLFDTEEIVVKALSQHLKGAKCFAGATIMGDGRVAMILDASGIAEHQRLRFGKIGAEELRRRKEEERARQGKGLKTYSILLFNSAPDEYFALPLESISRIEKVDLNTIHQMGSREFMDYRGEGLPLIRLNRFLPVSPIPDETKEFFVIVPKSNGYKAGILASRIVDAMQTSANVQNPAENQRGLAGTFFHEGRLTLMLEADRILDLSGRGSRDDDISRRGHETWA